MPSDKLDAEVNVIRVIPDSEELAHANEKAESLDKENDKFSSEQMLYILRRLNYDTLLSFDTLPTSVSYLLAKIHHMEVESATEVLQDFIKEHAGDANIRTTDYNFIETLLAEAPITMESTPEPENQIISEKATEVETTIKDEWIDVESTEKVIFDWELQTKIEAAIIKYHSPYPEVRAVTQPHDDPTLYCETLRVYVVGVFWTAIGAFINEFFMQRQPTISLNTAVVQVFLYPSGMFMAWALPKRKLKLWKWTLDLNPGPWNHKEQMLATLFYSVSGGAPYVSYNIPVLKMEMFYGVKWASAGYQVLLILSTQFMSFGFAGVLKKFVVYPTRAIWPSILPTLALNKALLQRELKENINGWKISKYNFFLVAFAASFVYFWFPTYLFEALSTFNWMTWIAPQSKSLAVVTGSIGGLGLNPVSSFDWNIINMNGALTIPFYSQLNQYIGSIIAFATIIGLWYSNYKWTGYLPINSNSLFTNTGERYAVSKILNKDKLIDRTKYSSYGPPFYTAASVTLYGAYFAIYPFTIVYMSMTHWSHMKFALRSVWAGFRKFRRSQYEGYNDAYSRSMRNYKEVPEWCYSIMLLLSIALAIICVKVYPMNTPVWTIFFALGTNFVFLIPLTLVYSITGFSFGLNVLIQLIMGYALPGNGIAMIFVKALGYNLDGEGQNFIIDHKMAHYSRIPPRALFRAQIVSTFMSSFISLAVTNFTMNNIDGFCTRNQEQKFTCPSALRLYNASVIWGVVGPQEVFSTLYPIFKWCFLIGFLLAPAMFLVKKYLQKYQVVKFFEPVLVIGGFLIYAPYNLSYYTPGLIVSYFFMSVIRNRYVNWFKKYNFLLSGALTAGVAFSSVIIFLAVQYHAKPLNWWGNTVPFAGLDEKGFTNIDPVSAPEGYFGPGKDTFA